MLYFLYDFTVLFNNKTCREPRFVVQRKLILMDDHTILFSTVPGIKWSFQLCKLYKIFPVRQSQNFRRVMTMILFICFYVSFFVTSVYSVCLIAHFASKVKCWASSQKIWKGTCKTAFLKRGGMTGEVACGDGHIWSPAAEQPGSLPGATPTRCSWNMVKETVRFFGNKGGRR